MTALIPPLLNQLTERRPETRIAALKALGEIGPKAKERAGKAVAQRMLDPNEKVALAAKDALEGIDPAVQKECTTIIVDPANRLGSIEVLGRLGKEARSATPILVWVVDTAAVVGSDKKKPYDVKAAAIRALAVVAPDDDKLPHSFLGWIGHQDADVRLAAVTGLPKLEKIANRGEAVTRLAKVLRTDVQSPAVRAAAAEALGEFGPDASSAEAALKLAAAESDKAVREAAERALARIRRER